MGEATAHDERPFGSELDLMNEVVTAGRKVGANPYFWSALKNDEELFRQVVEVVLTHIGDSESCSIAVAAKIMGNNFHGPTEVRRLLALRLRNKQFDRVPFSPVVLMDYKDTHVLVATPPVNIKDLYDRVPQVFFQEKNAWFTRSEETDAVGCEVIAPGWYLVRKEAMPGSFYLDHASQCAFVQEPDFVPEANLAVYAWVVHHLSTGEAMFSSHWLRTNSWGGVEDSRVGLYSEDGLLHVNRWVARAYDFIGIASARKGE